MTWDNLLTSIVIGSISIILGWYGRDYITYVKKLIQANTINKKRTSLLQHAQRFIIDYYVENSEGKFLFTLSNGKKIPFLTKRTWFGKRVTGRKVEFSETGSQVAVEIDSRIISERKAAGQNIWDGKILCLSGISETRDKLI